MTSTKTRVFNVGRKIFQLPLLELQLRKTVRGKSSDSILGKLVPSNYLYAINSMRSFRHEGITMELDIHDYVAHYLYFGFKDEGLEGLFEMANKGDTVVDVGTNFGFTMSKLALKVGDTGKVYGFEPDKINFQICIETIALNSLTNLVVENVGLGSRKGNFVLVEETLSNRGRNRIATTASGLKSSIINVNTLDDWSINNKVGQVDLIKIDVEGYELNVLQGGRNVLMQFRPKLFIELDDENLRAQGQSAAELIKFLEELNYNCLHAISKKQISSTDDFSKCHYDIIAESVSS